MTLSKDYLISKIDEIKAVKADCKDPDMQSYHDGIIYGLNLAYEELTKPPTKKEKNAKKEINVEKTYDSVVHYYMDKKGYSKEEANKIAQSVIMEQIAK